MVASLKFTLSRNGKCSFYGYGYDTAGKVYFIPQTTLVLRWVTIRGYTVNPGIKYQQRFNSYNI